MRYLWIVAAVAVPALASPTSKYDRVWHGYEAELAKQCGAKHLEWLAPAELRDALDDYKQSAPRSIARRMSHAEERECRNSIAGASCSNVGDIEVAEEAHRIQQAAAHVCGEYVGCREQSDCDRLGS
ncbi:hypothetical protein [Sphingomonas sp. NFR15]|uniref:hypothetical protein n=1 Tax=Sphingomonas sp. NFR15 TaxID=1566282 RepID=UPI00115FC0D0|nr:hypothetical protein [Sphingomonas sp. NFR15]